MIYIKKDKSLEFKYDGGILEFVEFLDNKRESIKNKNEITCLKTNLYGRCKNNIEIQCSLKWNAGIVKMFCPSQIISIKRR